MIVTSCEDHEDHDLEPIPEYHEAQHHVEELIQDKDASENGDRSVVELQYLEY